MTLEGKKQAFKLSQDLTEGSSSIARVQGAKLPQLNIKETVPHNT
jgi:hypothetical protein